MNRTIETIGYPRAALIGNPSDGFYGRTIAFTFSNFAAHAVLTPADNVTLKSPGFETVTLDSVNALIARIENQGYDDSLALIQATIKKFLVYCSEMNLAVTPAGFTLQTQSDIPFQVGIGGSSAIIVAVLRALMQHYHIKISKPALSALTLSVETEELGIPGGLQDRVAQVYQGLMYMDFNSEYFKRQGFGHYQALNPMQLPSLYIAWRKSIAEGSEVFHNNIRERFANGDSSVLQAIEHWKTLTLQFHQALLENNVGIMQKSMNENFDRRAAIYEISKGNLEMIRTARDCGASAKFTGSGGAAVGIYHGEEMYQEMQKRFSAKDVILVKPTIAVATDSEY